MQEPTQGWFKCAPGCKVNDFVKVNVTHTVPTALQPGKGEPDEIQKKSVPSRHIYVIVFMSCAVCATVFQMGRLASIVQMLGQVVAPLALEHEGRIVSLLTLGRPEYKWAKSWAVCPCYLLALVIAFTFFRPALRAQLADLLVRAISGGFSPAPSQKLLYLRAKLKLEGTSRKASMLIDSGASDNFIQADLLKEWRVTPCPLASPIHARLADGTSSIITGILPAVRLQLTPDQHIIVNYMSLT